MPAHERRNYSRQVAVGDDIRPLFQSSFVLYILTYTLRHWACLLYPSLIVGMSSFAHIWYQADIQGITGTKITMVCRSSG